MPANCGLLPQRREFLEHVAKLCRRHGALLIFDEVITGFRLAFGGFAEVSGLVPDLVTWGKVIGGGFPVGAIAGRRALMDLFAPAGPVYQAGTLSANPVAVTAGLATLRALEDGAVYRRLETLGRDLEAALAQAPGVWLQRRGSLFWRALENGIYLPPSPYEVGFLSAAHSRADVAALAALCGG